MLQDISIIDVVLVLVVVCLPKPNKPPCPNLGYQYDQDTYIHYIPTDRGERTQQHMTVAKKRQGDDHLFPHAQNLRTFFLTPCLRLCRYL